MYIHNSHVNGVHKLCIKNSLMNYFNSISSFWRSLSPRMQVLLFLSVLLAAASAQCKCHTLHCTHAHAHAHTHTYTITHKLTQSHTHTLLWSIRWNTEEQKRRWCVLRKLIHSLECSWWPSGICSLSFPASYFSFSPAVGSGAGAAYTITGMGRITAVRTWEHSNSIISG